MQFMALFKLLPYVGVSILAVVTLFYYLRANILAKQKSVLESKIEGLKYKLSIHEKNIAASKKHLETMINNDEISKKLMGEVQDAKDTNEILNIINNSIKLHNKN